MPGCYPQKFPNCLQHPGGQGHRKIMQASLTSSVAGAVQNK